MRSVVAILLLGLLAGCSGNSDTPSSVAKAPPASGTQLPAAPEKAPEAKLPPGIVGKWRSSSENEPGEDDNGKLLVMEVEFKRDGTYVMKRAQRFDVRDEYGGTCAYEEGKLSMTPEWSDKTFMWTTSLTEDRLVLSRRSRPGWSHTLERSDEPHPALAKLPPRPRTIAEAVKILKQLVPTESQQKIRAMEESDLIGMHFGLGMYIRNAFGLWREGSELLKATGSYHPDDASGVILEAFWKSLKEDG